MEFRLIYAGKLPAASSADSRSFEKHQIRKQLHTQLKALWKEHPGLSVWLKNEPTGEDDKRVSVKRIADNFSRCGYRFVPLIRKENGLACHLNILFLRRDIPGNLISSGGDIDNRIKVLFDGLRMPENCSEVQKFAPEDGEDPFFVYWRAIPSSRIFPLLPTGCFFPCKVTNWQAMQFLLFMLRQRLRHQKGLKYLDYDVGVVNACFGCPNSDDLARYQHGTEKTRQMQLAVQASPETNVAGYCGHCCRSGVTPPHQRTANVANCNSPHRADVVQRVRSFQGALQKSRPAKIGNAELAHYLQV